jgi:type I restriction enzyme S subunit
MSVECSSSNIQPGYKQTEVGVIPEDWSFDYIENLSNITTGGRNTQDRVDDGLYPFFVRSQTVERINTYSFDGEAVLTAGDGVGTGKIFHYINGKFDAHQRVYRISDFNERIKGYFFYLYFSSHFYNRIMQMTAKSSVDSVRREMIARMLIPVPPKAEQEAIAECLGDADALIESLEQLISKKRQIKQGAMQELLTGKRRLPGFSGEWSNKRLMDLAVLSKAGVNPASFPDTQFAHFSLPAFDAGEVPVIEEGSLIGSNKFLMPMDAVLLSKLNPRIPRIWAPSHIPENSVCSTEFLVLVPPESTDRKFLAALCCSSSVCYQMELHATGTTGSHQRIHPSQALTIEVRVPHDKAEQTAIAAILSDMDSEITALEEKLAKARQLKQGMMQELLTGRTRLL